MTKMLLNGKNVLDDGRKNVNNFHLIVISCTAYAKRHRNKGGIGYGKEKGKTQL